MARWSPAFGAVRHGRGHERRSNSRLGWARRSGTRTRRRRSAHAAMRPRALAGAALATLALAGCSQDTRPKPEAAPPLAKLPTLVQQPALRYHVPPLLDRRDVYAADAPNRLSPVVKGFRSL